MGRRGRAVGSNPASNVPENCAVSSVTWSSTQSFSCPGSCLHREWAKPDGNRQQGIQCPGDPPGQWGRGWRNYQDPKPSSTSSAQWARPRRAGFPPEKATQALLWVTRKQCTASISSLAKCCGHGQNDMTTANVPELMSISKMSPPHQRISVSLQDGVASYGYSWLLHPCKPYWPMPLGTAWPLGTSCPGAKTTSQLFIRMGQKQKSVNTKSISQLLLPIPWMLLFNPAGTGLLQICMQTQSISLWPDSFLLIFLFFFFH